MNWDALLLLIVGLYSTVKSSQLAYRLKSLKYLSYALSILFFVLGQGAMLFENIIPTDITLLIEFSTVIAVSFVLCGLAVFIRDSKPVFAQFPLIYAAAPLLLIFSYWFVKDSFAIKAWLLSIYQAGALLVGLMMYGAQSYRNPEEMDIRYMLIAIAFFVLTYLAYWFIPEVQSNYQWIWQLLLGISLMATTQAFRISLKQETAVEM
ncbi:hypothetical protein NC796_24150 [Aliifodinibius sp. S!AR15-10]|uniref:hypothetical protein n=1 Tax=Aliifodinibius sp. S!AR15-10 TaxID=2950437 RepID=UPI00285C8273|nr:hypothetical protein [Aliifodinibius sp. S!AR15-10]MDR8394263.1 hypothetical protein [Aliifodinibius sp. S!AR15-10]